MREDRREWKKWRVHRSFGITAEHDTSVSGKDPGKGEEQELQDIPLFTALFQMKLRLPTFS